MLCSGATVFPYIPLHCMFRAVLSPHLPSVWRSLHSRFWATLTCLCRHTRLPQRTPRTRTYRHGIEHDGSVWCASQVRYHQKAG